MLDERKSKLIDLLIEGKTTKVDIAAIIGVSRQAIYDWLADPEVAAELDKRLQAVRDQTVKGITAKLEPVVEELYKIALSAKDTRSRKDACIYLINRVLGSPTSNLNAYNSNNYAEDITNTVAEFKAFMSDIEDNNAQDEDENS